MEIRWAIEYRLTAWYAAMLFAGLTVLGVTLWMLLQRSVHAETDGRLRERVTGIVDYVSVEADSSDPEDIAEELLEYLIGLPEGYLTQVRDAEGRQVFPPVAATDPPIDWESVGAGPAVDTIHTPSGPYRVGNLGVSILGREYAVSVASSLQSLADTRARLVTSLLVAIPFAVLLCAVAGLHIARRALAPVEDVTRAASEITVESLERRIAVPDTGDALERLARTFNDMLERLEVSVSRIEQFSTDASHELRSPISVIRTTAELALRHGRSQKEYRSDLKEIEEEARRLGELIDVLLTLARTGTTDAVPMNDIDLVALVADVSRSFERETSAKGLELTRETPDVPALVRGHDSALRRLVMVLFENALAHTHEGGIAVSVTREKQALTLRVRDTGEGIPPEALGRVFDRFFRVDSARSRDNGRLGVGLSIAKRIAELHHAEIHVMSRLGEGTEFAVRFPESIGQKGSA